MLAGKLFKVNTQEKFQSLAEKLASFKVTQEDPESKLNITIEFSVNSVTDSDLSGTIYWDKIIYIGTKEGKKPAVSTASIPVFFRMVDDTMFLFILAKKPIANFMANEISKALFIRPGFVVEARIEPSVFLNYYQQSLDETRVAYFDQVDIPNVNVLALYGDMLSQTDLFKEYQDHGLLWYIVVKAKNINQIIGLTRNCVITMFSKGTLDDLVRYAFSEVAPLVLELRK
jgi:hypothetical protein